MILSVRHMSLTTSPFFFLLRKEKGEKVVTESKEMTFVKEMFMNLSYTAEIEPKTLQ